VETAGLRSHVAVLEPTEAVRDLYAAADVLVSPSRAEGVPLAAFEALAMGLPVVASNIPGHAYIGEAVKACHLAALEGSALAASISAVLRLDRDERQSEQEAARAWVREHLDLRSWPQALMEIYERLLLQIVSMGDRESSLPAGESAGS
jgi:glycosyltransferase involved in cell wall biosynthesis